jgi:hypothetical protein
MKKRAYEYNQSNTKEEPTMTLVTEPQRQPQPALPAKRKRNPRISYNVNDYFSSLALPEEEDNDNDDDYYEVTSQEEYNNNKLSGEQNPVDSEDENDENDKNGDEDEDDDSDFESRPRKVTKKTS